MQTKQELLNKMSKMSGYQKTKERIKTCNGNFIAELDSEDNVHSTSYGWWSIVDNKNGLYFFNWHSYSVTTRKHQNEMSSVMRGLNLDYITVDYSGNLSSISLERILDDKVNSLYNGENALSLSRATKYAVYSENAFNDTMNDIKAIQKALKLSDKALNEMLLKAELAATETMFTELADKTAKEMEKRELVKANQDLSAIQL